MSKSIEVKMTVSVEEQQVTDLMISVMDGACKSWAVFQFPKNWKEKCDFGRDIPMSGGKISVFDYETDDLLGVISRHSIREALIYMARGKDINDKDIPMKHFQNVINDNSDYETADVFAQLCVMGEIVYG